MNPYANRPAPPGKSAGSEAVGPNVADSRGFEGADLAARARVISLFDPAEQLRGAAATRNQPHKVALVGTYTPRKCGIATFTGDIVEQLARYHPEIGVDVYALDNAVGAALGYDGVAQVIAQENAEDYVQAARRINESGADAVWLQHEYGIYGGDDGQMVCEFVDRLAPPLVVTLHTVLSEASAHQERILRHLIARASRMMVMSKHAAELLVSRYGAQPERVRVIPHGAPDRPFGRSDVFKARMGLTGRKVLMTFGLLGPGKGLERVIEALPAMAPMPVSRNTGATAS